MMFDPPALLVRLGIRGAHMRLLSMGAVGLCLALWIRAKTVTQVQRGNAERRALFVGLWPPTIYLLGESLERSAAGGGQRRSGQRKPSRSRRPGPRRSAGSRALRRKRG